MVLGLIYSIYVSAPGRKEWTVLALAILIFMVRVGLKIIIVILLEEPNSFWDVFDKIFMIMYNGASACKSPFITIMVFRLCGILQWLVFYMFTTLLK